MALLNYVYGDGATQLHGLMGLPLGKVTGKYYNVQHIGYLSNELPEYLSDHKGTELQVKLLSHRGLYDYDLEYSVRGIGGEKGSVQNVVVTLSTLLCNHGIHIGEESKLVNASQGGHVLSTGHGESIYNGAIYSNVYYEGIPYHLKIDSNLLKLYAIESGVVGALTSYRAERYVRVSLPYYEDMYASRLLLVKP